MGGVGLPEKKMFGVGQHNPTERGQFKPLADKIVEQAFQKCDLDHSGQLSKDQFKLWVKYCPQVLEILDKTLAKHVWKRTARRNPPARSPDASPMKPAVADRKRPKTGDRESASLMSAVNIRCTYCNFKVQFCVRFKR